MTDIETMSNEARDRTLYKILINEGFSREDAASLIATTDRAKLDELLTKLMADPRRQRDVEIMTPDQLSDGVVDFNATRIQAESERSEKEMDADQAHWERVRDQLMTVMATSGLAPSSLTSATLHALLDVLQTDDTTLEKTKNDVAMCLNAFFI